MEKTTKIWLVVATSLIIGGLILFAAAMTKNQWDFAKLSTVKYVTNSYEIIEEFSNLSINTDTADIKFLLSDDGKCSVQCFEDEKSKHSVTVEGDTLVINVIDKRTWYDYIGIDFASPEITVYLPKAKYTSLLIAESTGDIKIPKNFEFKDVEISLSTGDVDYSASASELLKISASTGDIFIDNISVGILDLSVSTGNVNFTDIKCKNLKSSGNTGDISLKNVIAAEKFLIERTTGDIKFNRCDANEIFIETDTGDVSGSLLSDKVFITQTDTGSIDTPKTVNGGKCEIITDTGDIKIKIENSSI